MEDVDISDLLKDWYAVREHLPEKLFKEGAFDPSILRKIDRLSDQLH